MISSTYTLVADYATITLYDIVFKRENTIMPGVNSVQSFRKLVRKADLNSADRLFGGTMLAWADEAAALYAMCQLKTKSLVTLKFSEVIFKEPVFNGDIVVFNAWTKDVGNSSFTVSLEVKTKAIDADLERVVLTCDVIFVTIDRATGKSRPHNYTKDNS